MFGFLIGQTAVCHSVCSSKGPGRDGGRQRNEVIPGALVMVSLLFLGIIYNWEFRSHEGRVNSCCIVKSGSSLLYNIICF